MERTTEIALCILIFYIFAYKVKDTKEAKVEVKTKPKPQRTTKMCHYIHKYRTEGVNRLICEDIADELERRGLKHDSIPWFDKGMPPYEVAANLQVLLEEVPYVPTNLLKPGEDKVMAQTSMQIWPRKIERDDA